MKLVPLMIFGAKRDTEITIKIEEARIKESEEQNLLGITVDQSFSFKHTSRPFIERQAINFMLLSVYPATWTLEN